jgi:FdhE protein
MRSMPAERRIVGDMTNIGEQAKPPFAVLPDPSLLFLGRAERFAALAPDHELGPYLDFLAKLAAAQHEVAISLPPVSLPPAERMTQALAHGMPPLHRAMLESDALMLSAVEQLVALLGATTLPSASAAAIAALRGRLHTDGPRLVASILKDEAPSEDMAQRVLVLAGLQVHFTPLAAALDANALKPIANAACPACGSPPMSSAVVGWPKAYNTRYCSCGLCGTMWNVIRVMCVLCGATDGVSFRAIDGKPDTVKAETCESCRSYVKIVYQVNDMTLEPLCDDVATAGLDMLLAEEGWKRGGQNPFLLGY